MPRLVDEDREYLLVFVDLLLMLLQSLGPEDCQQVEHMAANQPRRLGQPFDSSYDLMGLGPELGQMLTMKAVWIVMFLMPLILMASLVTSVNGRLVAIGLMVEIGLERELSDGSPVLWTVMVHSSSVSMISWRRCPTRSLDRSSSRLELDVTFFTD